MPTRKQKCLAPGCKECELLARGLCSTHYWQIYECVRRGDTTWKAAEKLKLCLPRAKPGRKRGVMYAALVKKQK